VVAPRTIAAYIGLGGLGVQIDDSRLVQQLRAVDGGGIVCRSCWPSPSKRFSSGSARRRAEGPCAMQGRADMDSLLKLSEKKGNTMFPRFALSRRSHTKQEKRNMQRKRGEVGLVERTEINQKSEAKKEREQNVGTTAVTSRGKKA